MIQKEVEGAIFSGSSIHLVSKHTRNLIDVQADVQARWADYGNWQKMIIEKEGNGAILPGDVIFLRAHTGNQIDVSGTSVQARWSEKGLWQSLVVEQATSRRLNVLDESTSVAAEAILII